MDNLRFNPKGPTDSGVDLVPGEDFLRGDVISLANGMIIAEQPQESFGEVAVPGENPQ